jgi:WD40 repeat protein
MVVVGTQEGELSAWNMKSGSRQRIYGSLGQPIMVCATRADLLIAGLADGQIVAWRKGDEEPLLNFQGHSAALSALAIHPDQHLLFTASLDGEYSLWDIVQGIRLTSRRLKSVVTSAVWGDNYILVFGNSTGHLWAMTMN